MAKFIFKFEKAYCWPIFVPFPSFGGKNVFLKNPALSDTT